MTVTTRAPPPRCALDLMAATADLLSRMPQLDDGDVSIYVRPLGTSQDVHVYINDTFGAASLRRDHINALSLTLGAPVEWLPQDELATNSLWGTLRVTGRWAGAPVFASTPLTRLEAIALGYAVRSDCGHVDTGDDWCHAAMTDADGMDRLCGAGSDPVEPVVAVLTDAQVVDFEVSRERRDEAGDFHFACDGDADGAA